MLGCYHITKKTKAKYENGTLVMPSDIRSEKHKDKKARRDNAYTILVSKAADGDYRYRPTLKSQYGNSSMTDVKTGKDVSYSGYHIPGVGLSDFKKIEGPATLDKDWILNTMIIIIFQPSYGENRGTLLQNPLLQEFIITCWTILGFVLFRMNETYVYKRWPKHRVRTGNGKKSSYVYHLYMKWYKRLFGTYRFTQHNFSQLLARKRNFEELDKSTQKEELANADDLISLYDNGIKENYKIIMDNKYAAIHDKYKDVVTALLDIVYPMFLRELHEQHKI